MKEARLEGHALSDQTSRTFQKRRAQQGKQVGGGQKLEAEAGLTPGAGREFLGHGVVLCHALGGRYGAARFVDTQRVEGR